MIFSQEEVQEMVSSLPKGIRRFMQYIEREMQNIGGATEEDLKQIVEMVIITQARSLYDFFDEEGLYIQIVYGDVQAWWYRINDVEYETASSRQESEKAAFTKAFKLLEEK